MACGGGARSIAKKSAGETNTPPIRNSAANSVALHGSARWCQIWYVGPRRNGDHRAEISPRDLQPRSGFRRCQARKRGGHAFFDESGCDLAHQARRGPRRRVDAVAEPPEERGPGPCT